MAWLSTGPVPDNLKSFDRRLSILFALLFLVLSSSLPYHLMLPSIIFILALSFPFSVAAVPPRRDEPLHIPLIRRRSNVRRDSDGADLDHYAALSSGMRGKYGFESRSPSRRAQTTDVGITNQVRLSSTTDSSIRLTVVINNTTRGPIQVTLPKSASALRECESL